jgi:hypothetical protein
MRVLSPRKRIAVAFVAALTGFVVVGWYFSATLPSNPHGSQTNPHETDLKTDSGPFEWLLIFYGTICFVGRFLYLALGARLEAQELQGWSRRYAVILHALAAAWLLVEGWRAFRESSTVGPSLLVGILMGGVAVSDGVRIVRLRRSKGRSEQ